MRVIIMILVLNLVLMLTPGCSQTSLFDKLSKTDLIVKFPYKDSVGVSYNKTISLTKSDWEDNGLNKIESFNPDFKYVVYGKSYTDNYRLLLIARDYDEKNIHWLVLFNTKNQFVDFLQLAYDNSEGFVYKTSVIYNKSIKVKEWMDERIPNEKETTYLITNKGFEK